MPRLTMPGFEDLTPDQDRVLRLPDDGRYLVYGPPGTGKTVVAMLRAVAMMQRKRTPCIIMFNYLLNEYCNQMLSKKRIRLEVDRYNRWFSCHYQNHFGVWPPEVIGPDGKPQKYKYDWAQIIQVCAARNPPIRPGATPLLIDEGQDLPPGFYEYAALYFRNIIVFADQNQMIIEEEGADDRIRTICEKLQIPATHRYRLDINQRNTLQIARVSKCFYTGDAQGIPDPPAREGAIPHLIAYDHIKLSAKRIIDHARAHPQYLVAVVTANNCSQDRMKAQLEPLCNQHQILFKMYRSDAREPIDFSLSGIFLLNHQSLKGLEFDSVFIVDLHEHFIRRNSQMHKKVLYVATSRARERLYMLHERQRDCPVLECMPEPEILERTVLEGEVNL